MNKFLKEFKDRGYFYQCTNEKELSYLLENEKIKAYIGFVFLSIDLKKFFNIFLILLPFFVISFSDRILRVLSLPDGSPILVVPPPNNTIGLCPCFCRSLKHII